MPKDPEPRSYSVEEMMDELRKGKREKSSREEAELVTRPDGSQVMRVRKRKRRKESSARGRKKLRPLRYGLFLSIGFVVLVIIIGVSLLLAVARFNSKGFRDNLSVSLGEAAAAKVRFTDLSINPFKSRLKSAQLTWSGEGIPKSLQLSELDTRLDASSFLSSRLRGGELRARFGTLKLGPPLKGNKFQSLKTDEFLEFGSYRCSQFDLEYGTDGEVPILHLRDSELTARQLENQGGLQFLLNGGFVRFGSWAELKVSQGLGEWSDGVFQLSSLNTKIGETGEARFKGLKPITDGNRVLLNVQLIQFPMAQLLGEESMGRLFRGQVDARTGTLSFDPRQQDSGQLEVQFVGKEIGIEGFRFLGGLASILRKERYARPEGGTMKGSLKWNRDRLEIRDLRYEIRSNIVLTGTIVVSNQQLSGALRLGVPEALMMKTLTEPRYSSFSVPSQGYCWTEVKLGGTLEQPSDNFLKKLQASPVSPDSGESPPLEKDSR